MQPPTPKAEQEEESQRCPQCGLSLAPFHQHTQDVELTQNAPPGGPHGLIFCPTCRFPVLLVAGKYRLCEIVARGGFATLYRAVHTGLSADAERAVKVLHPELFDSPRMLQRYWQEIQITARLSQQNPHIVRIYDDFGEIPNLGAFYVMEFLPGVSLRQRMEASLSLELIVHLFRQLCEAMEAAHGAGVLHRDLKPENLMVIAQSHDPLYLKVLDFGIARQLQATQESHQKTTSPLGTPAYMSPEQYQLRPGQEIDERTDIFAMGVILYELLTGSHPFARSVAIPSSLEFDERIWLSPTPQLPAPLSSRCRYELPSGLEEVVHRALAWRPRERYESVQALRAAFDGCGPTASGVSGESLQRGRDQQPLPSGMTEAFGATDVTSSPGEAEPHEERDPVASADVPLRTKASPKRRRRRPLPPGEPTSQAPSTSQPISAPAPVPVAKPLSSVERGPEHTGVKPEAPEQARRFSWVVLLFFCAVGVVLVVSFFRPEKAPQHRHQPTLSALDGKEPSRHSASAQRSLGGDASSGTSVPPRRRSVVSRGSVRRRPTRNAEPGARRAVTPRAASRGSRLPRSRLRRPIRRRQRRRIVPSRRTVRSVRRPAMAPRPRPSGPLRSAPGCPTEPLIWTRLRFSSKLYAKLRPQLSGGKVVAVTGGFCVGGTRRQAQLTLGSRTEGVVPCVFQPLAQPPTIRLKMEREGGLEPGAPDYCLQK